MTDPAKLSRAALYALDLIVNRRVVRPSTGPFKDSRTGTAVSRAALRQLVDAGLVKLGRYGDLVEPTDTGRARYTQEEIS
jgi:hypothetical protein